VSLFPTKKLIALARDYIHRATAPTQIKRNFYEGGKRNGSSNLFIGLQPFESTAGHARDVLRARARYLHENNGIVSGIDSSIKVNSIGNGLKFQSKTGDANLDNAIEKLWGKWIEAENCDYTQRENFNDMQKTILGARMTDGEILINKVITKSKNHPLKLQLIEVDRFAAVQSKFTPKQNFFVDGIELGTRGEPKYFNITEGWSTVKRVPAKNIIHYYKRDNRPSQYRGISEYKQTIVDLRNFAKYTQLTVEGASARASLAYAVETENLASHQNFRENNDANEPIEFINDAFVYYLNKGEKMHQLDGAKSTGEFGEFIKATIRLIAVGRKISYELAFRDYSQVNFSSARASILQDHKKFDEEQILMARYVLTPIFKTWIEANVLAGNLPISPFMFYQDRDYFEQPRWVAPKREWVNPLQDIKAIEKELALGLITYEDVLGSRGKDLHEVIEQKKKENELLKEAGIITQEELKSA